MPSKTDSLRVGPANDGRRKLMDDERAEIRRKYLSANIVSGTRNPCSMRSLAAEYGVSRRLIQFCVYPERDKVQKERVKKERRWLKWYDKEKHRDSMRKLREKKKRIHGSAQIQT